LIIIAPLESFNGVTLYNGPIKVHNKKEILIHGLDGFPGEIFEFDAAFRRFRFETFFDRLSEVMHIF